MHSEFGGNCTKNNSAVGEDVHTCTSLVFMMECSLWGTNGNGRIKWRYKNTSRDRLCFLWGRAESIETVDCLNITEFVEQLKNHRDSNGASASQVWRLHTFLNLFFVSEFCFSMISLLISPQNSVDISYFKRVMCGLLLEFISLDLSASTVWHRPYVLGSLVWFCACCCTSQCCDK